MRKNRNDVTVIIPFYNEEKYLRDQLEAVLDQQYNGRWELILINNRSTDESLRIAREFKASFRNVKLIDALEKQGKPYALNKGINRASGDKILFTDAHCIVAPGWLKKMAATLSKSDFVAGGIDVQRLNGDAPNRTTPFTGSKTRFLGFLPYCIGSNMGVSLKALNEVGGFSEDAIIGQDADISFRLQLAGYALVDRSDAVVHMRYRESVDGLLRQTYKYAFAHAYLYKKFRHHGMKRRRKSHIIKGYYGIAKDISTWKNKSRGEKHLCLRSMAANYGRISGSIHHRVLYL